MQVLGVTISEIISAADWTVFQLYPVAMWLPGVLSRADGAFICLWLVFYSLEASG